MCDTCSKAAFSASGAACVSTCNSSKPETGAHLWAERFDKPVADLFEMQDEIVSHLANRLGQELVRAEAGGAPSVSRHPDPDSMDHYFLGLAALPSKAMTARASRLRRASHFDRALELDPNNVEALDLSRALADLWLRVSSWLSEDQQERFRVSRGRLAVKRSNSGPTTRTPTMRWGYLRILSRSRRSKASLSASGR